MGIQQSSLLKEAIIEGLNIYGESFTFTKLKNRLIESEDNSSLKLVGRISKLLDKDPFLYDKNNFSWNQIFSNQGKVHIFQLKGYVADIQKLLQNSFYGIYIIILKVMAIRTRQYQYCWMRCKILTIKKVLLPQRY